MKFLVSMLSGNENKLNEEGTFELNQDLVQFVNTFINQIPLEFSKGLKQQTHYVKQLNKMDNWNLKFILKIISWKVQHFNVE